MNLVFDIVEILKVTTVLFAVIDVVGSIPAIINLRQSAGSINAFKASLGVFGDHDCFLICWSKHLRNNRNYGR